MHTESVEMIIRPIPGAFGGNPPCVVKTPIGRRIADSLESAIALAESIGAGIVLSRLPEETRDSATLTYEINGGNECPADLYRDMKDIRITAVATDQ